MPLLRKLVSIRVYLLSFVEAMLIAVCYLAAVLVFHPLDAETYLDYEGGGLRIALATLTFLLGSYLFDFYRHIQTRARLLLALQLSQLIGIILLLQAVLAFISPEFVLPQPVVLIGSVLMLLVLIPWRLFLRPAIWNAFGAQRVLVIGTSTAASDVIAAFTREPDFGMEISGHVDESGTADGDPVTLMKMISRIQPDRIMVAGDNLRNQSLIRQMLELKALGVSVQTAGQVYESVFSRIDCRGLDPYVVVFLDELAAKPASVALQSVYTNIIALVAVVISLPAILVTMAALKLSGRGAALMKYTCAGLHGIPFNMYRFRATTDTAIGRFLNRYHLDGLPQVLNLIRGEMALIGPRAERLEYDTILHNLIPFYRQKQFVKPGIFGWSQLYCDPLAEEDTLKRLEYDLYYIKHISVVLDAYIMLRAVKWILSGRESAEEHATLTKGVAG